MYNLESFGQNEALLVTTPSKQGFLSLNDGLFLPFGALKEGLEYVLALSDCFYQLEVSVNSEVTTESSLGLFSFVASLGLISWILQMFPPIITWVWLFLLEQSYLLTVQGRERQESLALYALPTIILECQAIVVSLKIKFPSKKTSKD